jgi:hypothetical protein
MSSVESLLEFMTFGPQSITSDDLNGRTVISFPVKKVDPNGAILIVPEYVCQKDPTRVLGISGRAMTDGAGEFEWRSSDLICHPDLELVVFLEPVSFVATAHIPRRSSRVAPQRPTVITSSIEIITTSSPFNEVVFMVQSWSLDGQRLPGVDFSYWCRIPWMTSIP